MCAVPLTVMLLEAPKDQTATLALREKQVDQECLERKEILVQWETLEILVLLVTVE